MFLAVTRLGLIACQHLTKGYKDGCYVSAPEIAEQYNMNVRALMPALRQLTKAGILKSRVGGREPGFIFARDPEKLTVLDIVLILEGDTEFMCCMDRIHDLKCNCTSEGNCIVYESMNSIVNLAKHKLSTLSLNDYMKRGITAK